MFSFLKNRISSCFKKSKLNIQNSFRGFTLIEIATAIGIMTIVSLAATVYINPLELAKQTRDSKRINDLQTINKSLSIMKADNYGSFGSSNTIYLSLPEDDGYSDCRNYASLPTPSVGWSYHCASTGTLSDVSGYGWITTNFTAMSSGSPLATVPFDPLNITSGNYFYAFAVDNNAGTWVLTAILESVKHSPMMLSDGGQDNLRYEVGDVNLWALTGIGASPRSRSWAFNSSSLYLYDPAKIEISSSLAKIVPAANIGNPYTWTVNNASNYTLSNSAEEEVLSGGADLINLSPGGSKDWNLSTAGDYTYDSGKISISGGVGNLIASASVQALVVGGGGGGGTGSSGNGASGGGGGGGVVYHSSYTVNMAQSPYTVTVGGGGASDQNGTNSVFGAITALGGGRGGAGSNNGSSGGSGGGAGANSWNNNFSGGAATQGNSGGGTGYGYAGGNVIGSYGYLGGGGGGGASSIGVGGSASPHNGGSGFQSSISGSSLWYGEGGGGAGNGSSGCAPHNGMGCGSLWTNGQAGMSNRGDGGGGVAFVYGGKPGGAGGSGVVIVSYPTGSLTATPSGGSNSCASSGDNTVCTFTSSGAFTITAVPIPTTNPTITANTALTALAATAWSSFTETATKPSNTAISYQISSDNGSTYYWWNGSAWAVSDGTVSQANSASDINSHIVTFGLGTKQFKWKAFLSSTDGVNTPILDNINVAYVTVPSGYTPHNPTVTPNTSFSFPAGVSLWTSFTETATKNSGTELYYQLSNDGTNWRYWGGTSWLTAGTTIDTANTAATINTNIASFPTANNTLKWRAYLHSSGNQVTLSAVRITFNASSLTVKALWHLDGGGADSSGSSNTLSATGTNGWGGGKFGTSHFHENQPTYMGYLYVPAASQTGLTNLTQLTIDYWDNPNFTDNSGNSFGGVSTVNNNGFYLRASDVGGSGNKRINFGIGNASNLCTIDSGTTYMNSSAWNHLAGVWDGSYIYLFKNGVLVGGPTACTLGTINTSASNLNINNLGGGYQRQNYVDEVRISNIAQWTSNFTPPTSAYSDPTATFPSGSFYVMPIASQQLTPSMVTSWTGFEDTETLNGGQIKFQLSSDGGQTWKYWNGTIWDLVVYSTDMNTVSEVNSHISTFPTTGSSLTWKAWLISNGATNPQLGSVTVRYSGM